MSRKAHCSNPFHHAWNTLWNALTSTNANRGTATPTPTRQSGVPDFTKPQVSAFRSTHPLTGEAPTGTPPPPGDDTRQAYDHLDVILNSSPHIEAWLLTCPTCGGQLGSGQLATLTHNLDGSHTVSPAPEHSLGSPRVRGGS